MKAKIEAQNPEANLKNYDQVYKTFSWAEEEKFFSWSQTGKVNIVYEAIDRWAEDPEKQHRKALIFEKADHSQVFTYLDLKEKSSQLANCLAEHGLKAVDLLFIYLPPCPEIYLAMLACARLGVIFCPLYSTLNYHELEIRLLGVEPQAVLTHADLVENLPAEAMNSVEKLFLITGPNLGLFPQEVALEEQVPQKAKDRRPRWLPAGAPLDLMFTSGAAGPPNGVIHPHRSMIGYRATGRDVLDLNEGAVIWTDGDPAWITGMVYSAFAPWLCGAVSVVQGDSFSASTWYRTLERHGVEVWYTTPQRIKNLADAGQDLPERYDLSKLRHIATVGRPLAAEYFFWVKKNLKLTPHENWWMTETGMICLANFPSMPTKPGSMGKPVPGVEAGILDDEGQPLPILSMGQLALRLGWPAMMNGIWRNEKRYQDFFSKEGWFLTGDLAFRDEDGYYFHHGRMDDLLKVGEQMVGPFEVEQVLCRHPAVNEAAVISLKTGGLKPQIKAFVTLNHGVNPTARLSHAIKEFVKAGLSPDLPLTEVTFLDEMPKTRTGRILRRVLRAREMGLPTKDPASLQE